MSGESTYEYYWRAEDGAIIRGSSLTKYSKIYEGDGRVPMLEITKEWYQEGFFENWWSYHLYTLYVPVGTVKHSFDLDLE